MLDNETKTRIDTARDILVGKVPDPKSQVEQITIALIYKFMDDMDKESVSLGGNAVFFTGNYKKYAWSNIFDPRHGGFDMLALYSEAIEKLNHNPNIPQLFRDIFKNAYLPYRDPETLKLFLKTINEFTYEHSERLGDAFEYLLSVLGSQGDAGQFRTPRHIIDFIVSVVEPKKTDSILDPACGTAGFLISAYKYILEQNTKKSKGDSLTPNDRNKLMTNFFGYDISPDMVRLSLVNMYLHGFTTPFIFEYDTLTSEERWGDTFDVILANPPFMSPKGGIRPHKKFTLQVNRSEVLFVDYIAEHINPVSGRAGIIVPEGIIFQSSNAYKQLRKMLVDSNLLFAVVSLPAGVFNPYSGVKTSILLLDKSLAKKSDKILFVKIENDGFDLGAQRRENEGSNLPNAKDLIIQFKESLLTKSEFTSDNKNVFLIEKTKIASKEDYNLSIDRYRIDENVKQSNFEKVRLGDVADIISGQSPESEFYNDKSEGLPFYQGRTEFGDIYIGEPKTWTTKITKVAQKDDILMSVRAPVGPVNIATQEICIGRGIAAIRPGNKILLSYLFNYLRSIQDKIKGSGGAVFDSINRNQISDLEIPLPPLSVQKEIVAKIENYQAIINGAKQVVENYKPQIDINPDWQMVELDEICLKITDGSHFSPPTVNNGYPYITVKDIVDDLIDFENCKFIDEVQYKQLLKNDCNPLKNDILFSKDGTVGKVSMVDFKKEFVVLSSLAIVRPNDKLIIPKFLKIVMRSDYFINKAIDNKTGVAIKRIVLKTLKTIPVPLPSFEEQQEIVSRIEKEQSIINSNKELIKIYEQKIKDEINRLWKK